MFFNKIMVYICARTNPGFFPSLFQGLVRDRCGENDQVRKVFNLILNVVYHFFPDEIVPKECINNK